MIKKTFLAVAVGAALGAAGTNAATVAPDAANGANDFTTEAAENLDFFQVPDLDVTLAAEYQEDDEVVFVFDAPLVDETGAEAEFETTIDVTPATPGDYNMTLGLVSIVSDADSTTVKYRVTDLTTLTTSSVSTIGGTFDLNGAVNVLVDGDSGRSGFSVAYTAQTNDLSGNTVAIDTASNSAMITFSTQYSTGTSSGFSKTIDSEAGTGTGYTDDDSATSTSNRAVIASRSVFTDGTAIDSATITLADDDDGTPTRFAMTTLVTAVLNGDFTFLADSTAAAALSATMDGVASTSAVYTDSTATFTWAGTETAPVSVGDIVFSFDNSANGSGELAMDEGNITVDLSIAYSPLDNDYIGETANTGHAPSGAGYADAGNALGGWDMDGSRVNVYAVPYSPSASLFVWVTSTTSNDAPYTVTATDVNGNSVTAATGVLAPNSITTLGPDIVAGLDAAGTVAYGRVTLTIETSANMCDIMVYAGYEQTVDNDRLNLETSQTIQGIHNGGNSGIINDSCFLNYAD